MYISGGHRIFVHTILVICKSYDSHEILFFFVFPSPGDKNRPRPVQECRTSLSGTEFYIFFASYTPAGSVLKCTGEQSPGIEEGFTGCPAAQRFSRTVIELIHGRFDFMLRDSGQVPVFRRVLLDEADGVFAQSTLPGSIGMRETDTGIRVTCPAFVARKFLAFVIGDAVHPVNVRGQFS